MRRLFKWKRTWILLAACALFFGSYAYWQSGRGDMVIRDLGDYTPRHSNWLSHIQVGEEDGQVIVTIQERPVAKAIHVLTLPVGQVETVRDLEFYQYPAWWNPLAPNSVIILTKPASELAVPLADDWKVVVDENERSVTVKSGKMVSTYDGNGREK